jgi:hypothetical protein
VIIVGVYGDMDEYRGGYAPLARPVPVFRGWLLRVKGEEVRTACEAGLILCGHAFRDIVGVGAATVRLRLRPV